MKIAGPWMREPWRIFPATSPPEEGTSRESRDGVTLASVYPRTVYVRAGFGDEWTEVKTQAEADDFLRAAGWELLFPAGKDAHER